MKNTMLLQANYYLMFYFKNSINPETQNLPTYFFIFVIFGYLFFRKNKSNNNLNDSILSNIESEGFLKILRNRGWKYFLLAFIDVEANFAMVYAYQFTNITAIQLLNSFTIPAVMLLSCIFLSTRYKSGQFAAVAICLLGLGLTIYTDSIHDKGLNSGTNKFIGDFLCLIGTFLYAVSNVSEECLVKQYSR
ncbi:unnamed protein product [Meloidogyne enterolobii]|uniref:Uncharacterized protein n=1 Tax=Meloidogyne enterolobii TaxID=390850 RepID=A0ACB0YDV3_MELEN